MPSGVFLAQFAYSQFSLIIFNKRIHLKNLGPFKICRFCSVSLCCMFVVDLFVYKQTNAIEVTSVYGLE